MQACIGIRQTQMQLRHDIGWRQGVLRCERAARHQQILRIGLRLVASKASSIMNSVPEAWRAGLGLLRQRLGQPHAQAAPLAMSNDGGNPIPRQSFFAGEQRTPQARPVNSDHAWGRRAGGNMLKAVLLASVLGLGALLAPDFAGAAPGVSKIEVPSAVTEVGRRHHHRWHGHRHHRRGWHRHSGFRFYLGPRRYYGSGCGRQFVLVAALPPLPGLVRAQQIHTQVDPCR